MLYRKGRGQVNIVIYDVIIIGAGPAGLFTAINSPNNKRVLILEGNPIPGKKLLLTGGGQCNLTHVGEVEEFLGRYGNNGRFLKHALYSFSNNDTIKFFKDRGLGLIEGEEGKIFPKTLKARDVLNVLIRECENRGVEILCNKRVKKVRYKEGLFYSETDSGIFKSRNLVIATGGKSYPDTGSRGDGYAFAKDLGHSIEELKPALTPVVIKDYLFRDLSGVSLKDIPISLYRRNKKILSFKGDILFTHDGVSDPAILNYSRYMAEGDILRFNFIGEENVEDFKAGLLNKIKDYGKFPLITLLKDYNLPKRLLKKLLEILELDDSKTCAQLKKDERNKIVASLVDFPMEISRLKGYHIAMVTKGGVSLREVNPKTMESKIIKGLYFVGEVLDIDGDTGGYNIQGALSMGYLAGKSIK